MKHGWLKLADRLVRIDRVHEFWIERVEGGHVVKAAVFGSQDVTLGHFSTYDEAEDFLNRVYEALKKDTPMIDVLALKEGWDEEIETDLEDFDFWDPGDFDFDDDEDFPF